MNKILKFFVEAKTELQKVSWPTPIQALSMTLAVVVVSAVFALYIAGVDYVIVEGVKQITSFATKQKEAPATSQTAPVNINDIQTETVPAQ